MPAPYNVKHNYRGCSGYSVVGADGKAHGCMRTKQMATRQQRALYAATNAKKADEIAAIEEQIQKQFEADLAEETTFWKNSRFFNKK